MARKSPTRKKVAELIEAYENGDASNDLDEFLDTWAEILTPGKTAEPETQASFEVLVHGHPFDHGLTVEGPYVRGFLAEALESTEPTALYGGQWIVPMNAPSRNRAAEW